MRSPQGVHGNLWGTVKYREMGSTIGAISSMRRGGEQEREEIK